MIPGVMVAMGGRDWTVPPLTLGQLRRLMPKVRQLTDIGAQMDETQIGVLVEIVAAALQRNYPDMMAETVENLLDLGNAGAVLHAVLTGSGLRPREQTPGEAAAPEPSPGADAPIPATSTMMVGSASMGSSPPPAATPTRVIDAMTLLEVEELTRYWIEHPPLHLMVAAYLGLGKGNASRARSKIVADDPVATAGSASRMSARSSPNSGRALRRGRACRPRARRARFRRVEAARRADRVRLRARCGSPARRPERSGRRRALFY